MKERTQLIEWIRAEMVGPSRYSPNAAVKEAVFNGTAFIDAEPQRRGPLMWKTPDGSTQEVIYFNGEPPKRKYGIGLLHPAAIIPEDQSALESSDTGEKDIDDNLEDQLHDDEANENGSENEILASDSGELDDFEVTCPDVRRPSTLGISFCVQLTAGGNVAIHLPQSRRFEWQMPGDEPFQLNGRYESCRRCWTDGEKHGEAYMWRRIPAVKPHTSVEIGGDELRHGKTIQKNVAMPEHTTISLRVDVFPRWREKEKVWLLTVVLRNTTKECDPEAILFQSYFEVVVEGGVFEKYPESQRPFDQLDAEEQSLAMLYSESATWGIGHGCASGWDVEPGGRPSLLYADVLPAVQLPSMTPNILDGEEKPIELSMRSLASLPDDCSGETWESLENLAEEYTNWIEARRLEVKGWDQDNIYGDVAERHLAACDTCLKRIIAGINLLKTNKLVRRAFRLANLSMLLQQISTKILKRRALECDNEIKRVRPSGQSWSSWDIYESNLETGVGSWRAFQIAFLLMSLDGVRDGDSSDREVVDLIWFPTGGGKTEAYLGVMAFYMFHERLRLTGDVNELQRDGTNVLMRYTLRMLTTQQFQRAASLVCAMEFLRRKSENSSTERIPGRRFSLGLWIGREGSPNTIDDAGARVREFECGKLPGNPLVLTECPWCRAEIGRFEKDNPNPKRKKVNQGWTDSEWNKERTKGITFIDGEGPLLRCSDVKCAFGKDPNHTTWLPVEVIDERIYDNPPSLVISTADKLAIVAYRRQAGALFGRFSDHGEIKQVARPPGLIIQDELHLISGPLGTMYALYEAIFERLCSYKKGKHWVKPKLIASTATIRGAADQVKSLYARGTTQLFPSPGLLMGDSFFGKYAREKDKRLSQGRLYLGIHASNYGSILTTQVRTFASALFRPFSMDPAKRDPWWTLLAFFNSIRELGGARTLFESDIRSRLKFMFNREGFERDNRRRSPLIQELTSRRSQAEIVQMMDRLAVPYTQNENQALDVCLASNIIEVGVDIERLSMMGVVGQPKTTASYIQVTGRVGRRWWERPGLILIIYNPGKSRDRSHFEQFHSYHRRLYERVEPTSATPFAVSAIQRGLPGALITYARQQSEADVDQWDAFEEHIEDAFDLLTQRCESIQMAGEDQDRSSDEMDRVLDDLVKKWQNHPEKWEGFPQDINAHYLMLWPGQYATLLQKKRGLVVPSSMRQVDGSGELRIIRGYSELLEDNQQPQH